MKYIKLCLAALLTLAFSIIQAQQSQNVVILIDVSGSIPQQARTKTKEVVKDILLGRRINDPNFYYEKDPSSTLPVTSAPLVSNGSRILLIPFGEKVTSDYVKETTISSFPTDVTNFIDINYPTVFKDNFTFLTLAKAKAAQQAKSRGLSNFLLLVISDGVNDFTAGKSPNYTAYEQQLVENFNSKSNPILEGSYDGYVKFKGSNDFKIPLRYIDIKNYKAPPAPTTTVPPVITPNAIDSSLSIEFPAPYSAANRKKPVITKSNTASISWLCKNCPDNMKYNVAITQVEGGNFKDLSSRGITAPSVSKNLSAGTYKISVSGEVPGSNKPVSSATTYITVEGSGSLWWLWLLLIAAVVAVLLYLNKEKQKKKLRENVSRSKGAKSSSSILDSNTSNHSTLNEF